MSIPKNKIQPIHGMKFVKYEDCLAALKAQHKEDMEFAKFWGSEVICRRYFLSEYGGLEGVKKFWLKNLRGKS